MKLFMVGLLLIQPTHSSADAWNDPGRAQQQEVVDEVANPAAERTPLIGIRHEDRLQQKLESLQIDSRFLDRSSYNNAVREQVESLGERAQAACGAAQEEAYRCCSAQGALSCALGRENSDGDSVETMLGIAQIVLGGAVMTNGLAGACNAMKAVGYGGAALNGFMATSCGNKREQCIQSCLDFQNEMNAGIDQHCSQRIRYAVDYGSDMTEEDIQNIQASTAVDSPECIAHRNTLQFAQRNYRTCKDELRGAATQMGAQALASAVSGFAASQCGQQASTVDPQSLDPNGDDICADASNQTNPYCIVRNPNLCQLPANQNNSACSGYRNNPTNPTNGNFGGPTLGADNSTGDTVDGVDDFNQEFSGTPGGGGDVNSSAARLASTPGGGTGGGAPGGGGGGGGAAGAPGARGLPGGGARGYNTDILKGARGGSGYSVSGSPVQSGGGGFAGYGRGVASEKGADPKVNLKKYLPGKEKYKRRKLASVGAKGIGGKHKNLFKQVENRFNQLCLFDRLVCDKSARRLRKK